MSEFLMPSLGTDMKSAVLMQWLVKEGDSVKNGQVIAEVETSKGVIEIEVFEDGVVDKLLVEEDMECEVGSVLALISTISTTKDDEQTTTVSIPEPTKIEERLKISPAAKRRAKELGVDIDTIKPKGNTLTLEDIEKSVELKVEKKIEEPLSSPDSMRQAIAAAMSLSNKEIPHYYLSTSINMTPSLEYLEELNSKRDIKERILPAALLIKAVVEVLKSVPALNGFWKSSEHIISQEINPGIAIALRKKGLITPALLDAQNMDLNDTMKGLDELISRARSGKLKSSHLTKQTITITNLGDLGVDSVFGVIYPPQVAVVGLGKIKDKPWAIDDKLCVRKVMEVIIAGDHRATDGRTGARFLDKLDKTLQNPKELI
ncbi:MAG: dihydrolipoamide acetyltransferase family protein [Campylobacterota bacterium]|nr:dihydrolipoamide acetyltransferase family protein [Campylobacterota bacterium]